MPSGVQPCLSHATHVVESVPLNGLMDSVILTDGTKKTDQKKTRVDRRILFLRASGFGVTVRIEVIYIELDVSLWEYITLMFLERLREVKP
jgi:hypothetical protein